MGLKLCGIIRFLSPARILAYIIDHRRLSVLGDPAGDAFSFFQTDLLQRAALFPQSHVEEKLAR